MKTEKTIKWIATERIDDEFFINAIVHFFGVKEEIRFSIDKKTATNFTEALKQKPFKDKYGNDYSYWYSGYAIDKENGKFEHYLEIRLGGMRQKNKVECSSIFCQNLKWLSEIKSVSDLSKKL